MLQAALSQNGENLTAKGLLPGYQTYSTDQKQEVVNYAKETTVREASRKYNVPRSTVQVWCKHGPPTKKEKRSPGGGGRRLSYSHETDEKLLQWVLIQQEKGTPVTRDAIQAQARLLIRDECPEFKASSGWVEKFLARHNLTIATKMSSQNPSGGFTVIQFLFCERMQFYMILIEFITIISCIFTRVMCLVNCIII